MAQLLSDDGLSLSSRSSSSRSSSTSSYHRLLILGLLAMALVATLPMHFQSRLLLGNVDYSYPVATTISPPSLYPPTTGTRTKHTQHDNDDDKEQPSLIFLNTTNAAFLYNYSHTLYAMQQRGQALQHSARQHQHYQKRKKHFRYMLQQLDATERRTLLYRSPSSSSTSKRKSSSHLCGIQLHPRHDLAYREIYKNGGTTMATIGHRHLTGHEMLHRPWLVLVRDPVEHFLAGWGECGQRRLVRESASLWQEEEDYDEEHYYDARIRYWLDITRQRAFGGPKRGCRNTSSTKSKNKKKQQARIQECLCAAHSLAQVNYLIHNDTGDLYDNIVLMGDLSELPALVDLVGGTPSSSASGQALQTTGRNASLYGRRHLYPRRVDWLSNQTLLELCQFLRLDYWLLDYTPPPICQEKLFGPWKEYSLLAAS